MSRTALKAIRANIAAAARESGKYGIYCESGRYSQQGFDTELEAERAANRMSREGNGIALWVAAN